MKQIAPRVVVNEKVRFGKPVIKGTRVRVELVVSKLAGGMTMEQVQGEYDLTRADVLVTFDYAAKTVAAEEVRGGNEWRAFYWTRTCTAQRRGCSNGRGIGH